MSKHDPFGGATTARSAPSPVNFLTIGDEQIGLVVHNPAALLSRGTGDTEISQGLPPYAQTSGYRVEDLPQIPEGWQRNGKRMGIPVTSYVVGFKEESGIWFDLNRLSAASHDIAVIMSVQGVNAITGKKIEGQLELEQYQARGDEPPQNYLASNATPHPYLWIDGWRTEDGTVRQFVATRDTSRGVAAQLIGEARTHTFGFAFFKSVDPKPQPTVRTRGGYDTLSMNDGTFGMKGAAATRGMRAAGAAAAPEIAAGARIRQRIFKDPYRLDHWNKAPVGMVVVHYLFEKDLRDLIGAVRTAGAGEGPLSGLKVGN